MKSACSEDFKTDHAFDFGQLEAEKIKAKDTRGHFHFSHEYGRYYSVSAVIITPLDFQNINLTSRITFSNIFHTNERAFNQKITKN